MNLEDAIKSEEFDDAIKFLADISVLVRKASGELPRELYIYIVGMLEAKTHATLDTVANESMEAAGLVAQSRLLSFMEAAQLGQAAAEIELLTSLMAQQIDPEMCKECDKRETCQTYLDEVVN